jgi:hypothetical protein
MMAKIDFWLDKMEACLKKTEATEEIETESEHQEVPKEEAALDTIGVMKERYRDRHLAVRRSGQPKKLTQGNGGSRKKLAAACRGMTRHAGVARRNGRGHTGLKVEQRRRKIADHGQCLKGNLEKTDVREETSGETGRHQWTKEPRLKKAATSEEGEDNRQRHQRTEQETGATSVKTFRKTIELEIAKQIAETSIRLLKMSVTTLWRGQPSPKRKKRLHTE